MSEERKADMEAALAELEFEINLAIQDGSIPVPFQWKATFTGPDGEPWFAAMTIGRVSAA
jgi:hypothetical protein